MNLVKILDVETEGSIRIQTCNDTEILNGRAFSTGTILHFSLYVSLTLNFPILAKIIAICESRVIMESSFPFSLKMKKCMDMVPLGINVDLRRHEITQSCWQIH